MPYPPLPLADQAERVAVASHTEIVQWLGDKDPTIRRVFEELLAQEEEHADDLRGLLERIPADGR